MLVKYSLAGVAVVALLLGAFAVGRSVGKKKNEAPVTSTKPASRTPEHHEESGDDHHHMPAETPRAVTAEDRAKALEQYDAKIKDLNQLQEWLVIQLGEGTLTGADLLEKFRNEKDASILDVLLAALEQQPPVANSPEVVAAMLRFAREGDADHRQYALGFLGKLWDQDGEVRRNLLDVARTDPNLNLRFTAINSFVAYSIKNPQTAEAVNADLLGLAASDASVRAVSIAAVSLVEASDATVKSIAGFASDTDIGVRVSVYEQLGYVKAEQRSIALQTLENSFASERDEVGQGVIVNAVVRAGRADAIAALRRMAQRESAAKKDILAFLQVLEAGETDWERILQRKAMLEK